MESDPGVSRGEVESQLLHNECQSELKLNYCRWASEQAKARELGDVVEFARDLKLV